MKTEDLIKKLEKVDTPEIEISSHKSMLKKTLLEWKYSRKKTEGWFFVMPQKILMPAGALIVAALIFFVASNLASPQYTMAEVRKIAMENPQIKNLISEGASIKDIKIIDGKAYVLISPKEVPTFMDESSLTTESGQKEFRGALAEIQIKENKVSKIEDVLPQIILLTPQEEETAKKIITKLEFPAAKEQYTGIGSAIIGSESAKTMETKTLQVEKVEAIPTYNLRLEKTNGEVKILPQNTKNEEVRITYKINGETKEGEINLPQEKVENIKVLEGN